MLVQTCGGSTQFPGDLLLPQEADSGLSVRKCERISAEREYEKRSMLQQQRRRGPNRLQSAKKHPEFFFDRYRR